MHRSQYIPGVNDGALSAPPLPLQEGESALTPYENAQFHVADRIRHIRKLVTQLDEMDPDVSRITRVKVCQEIRKVECEAKLGMRDAKKLAVSEGRGHEFELLSYHFRKTLDLVRERYGGGLPVGKTTDNTSERTPLSFAGLGTVVNCNGQPFAESGNVEPRFGSGYSLENDMEFLQFFQEIRKNDAVIDEALDRIYTGVQRLNENAALITSELHVQEQMLEDTDRKVDDVHDKFRGLNKRLKKALQRMDRPMMMIYFFCCLILAAVIVVIYILAKN